MCSIWAAMRENRVSGFWTRSDSKRTVQPHKQVRILKFWWGAEEELCFLSRENNGADQLCSYCTADLRLCFLIGKNPVLS